MKNKKILRNISLIMALVLFGFIAYTLINPEATFPWGQGIPFGVYAVYVIIMFGFWAMSRRKGE